MKTLTLEHWTDVPDLEMINPSSHGRGVSGAESKRKRNSPCNWVDRSYYYLDSSTPEASLRAKSFVYFCNIPAEKVYNFHRDPLNLREKSMWGISLDINEYEKNIKNAGFYGYINRAAPGMSDVVAVFYPLKPINHVKRHIEGLYEAAQ